MSVSAASLKRATRPELRPFVELVWASDGAAPPAGSSARELVLPTGAMHVVFRLDDRPLRLFAGPDDKEGEIVAAAVLGGVRAGPYVKDRSLPAPTVGVVLRPGIAELVSGAPAGELAGGHWRLEDLWPRRELAELYECLDTARTPADRLELVERALVRRLPRVRGIDPLVAHTLARLGARASVGAVVTESGYSHRHVARSFRAAVGLGPKSYGRLARFGRVLGRCRAQPAASWADIAAAEGYADQAHMSREFHEFAGVSPGRYRAIAPAEPRHVPLRAADAGAGQIPSRPRAAARADSRI